MGRIHFEHAVFGVVTPKPPDTHRHPSSSCLPSRESDTLIALLARITGEFHEMPGLSLTLPQASRLFGIVETQCLQVLEHLMNTGLLRCGATGRYALKPTGV